MYSIVNVCDRCTVLGFEVLFCLICEGFPVGSFIISVCVSVASWGVSSFCGDDDREVVRT